MTLLVTPETARALSDVFNYQCQVAHNTPDEALREAAIQMAFVVYPDEGGVCRWAQRRAFLDDANIAGLFGDADLTALVTASHS